MSYHLSKKITLPFEEVISNVTEELKKEGFGIITTIDLKDTFKKRINTDFRKYVILGACNPRYAYESLLIENKLGVFLPCNVVVQEYENKDVEVSIVNSEELMHGIDDIQIKTFGRQIKEVMQNVLNRL